MENIRIIINNGDGTVDILIPSPKSNLTLDQIIAKDVPYEKSYRTSDKSKIPSDRYFRGAWTDDNPTDTVDINMAKARNIHMNVIRGERDKELARLDIEQLKGNDVVTLKQTLRDIPTTFDLNGSEIPEELKSLWPSEVPINGADNGKKATS